MKTLRVLLLLVLFGCMHKTPSYDPVRRPHYAYQRLNESQFIIATGVNDDAALRDALLEIGCGKGFVCAVEGDGERFLVEIHHK